MKDVEVVEVEKESRIGGFQAPQARDSVTVLTTAFSTILKSTCNFMRAKSPTSGELTPPFVEAKGLPLQEPKQASDQNGMAEVDTEDKCEKKQASEQHGMAAGDKPGGYDQGRVKRSETPPNLSTRTPVIMGPPVLPKIYVTKACSSHSRGSDKKRKALSAPVPVLHTRKFDMFEGLCYLLFGSPSLLPANHLKEPVGQATSLTKDSAPNE